MDNDDSLIGRELGTCRIERVIGRGGMGMVYLAQQTRPTRRVAVKVLHPESFPNMGDSREFLLRFQREADLIAQLEHVNIMPIYEYGERDTLAYLVMPYLTGGSLRDMLARKGPLSLSEAVIYIEQAAAALDYAHAHGVIHRDIKPGNFLLHADGRLVLSDFGIARIMQSSERTTHSTLTATGVFLGTPEYMAPEMALGEPVDQRADIYEMGVVLYQMLSGSVPFKGNTPLAVVARQLQEPLPLLHAIKPEIPEAVDSVIQKATAKKRENRFATMGECARALRNTVYVPGSSIADNEQNIPTVLSSHNSVIPATIETATPGYETPLPMHSTSHSGAISQRPEPSSGGFSSISPVQPATVPVYQPPIRANRQSGLIFIGILLVIALVIGGVLVGLQLNRETTPSTTGGITPQSSRPTTAPASGPTISATGTTIPATAPTQTHAPTPTTIPTPVPTQSQANQVPKGAPLYSTTLPGSPCDHTGGRWVNYNSPTITCAATGTELSNNQGSLAGTLLITLPGGAAYPANYVVEVQLQQAPSSNTDFGIYFRNQPGNAQGIYTFLIHQDGTWSAFVYNNTTGAPTQIAGGGIIGDAHASMLVDVVVNGANFTFYVNGNQIGSVSDATYAQGTVGIAVDSGGTISASNLVLYATQ